MSWVKLFGENEAVEVVGGDFDGQRGYVVEVWLDAKDGARSPITYVVHLDTSGVNERIPHDHLKSLGRKHESVYEKYPEYRPPSDEEGA